MQQSKAEEFSLVWAPAAVVLPSPCSVSSADVTATAGPGWGGLQ